jgi:hypothetical protein
MNMNVNIIEETKKIKWVFKRLVNEVKNKKNTKIRIHYFEDESIDPKSEKRMMEAFDDVCFGEFELLYANIRNKKIDFEWRVCDNGAIGFLFWLYDDKGKRIQDDPIVQKTFKIRYWKSYLYVIYKFFSRDFYELKKGDDIQAIIEKECNQVTKNRY